MTQLPVSINSNLGWEPYADREEKVTVSAGVAPVTVAAYLDPVPTDPNELWLIRRLYTSIRYGGGTGTPAQSVDRTIVFVHPGPDLSAPAQQGIVPPVDVTQHRDLIFTSHAIVRDYVNPLWVRAGESLGVSWAAPSPDSFSTGGVVRAYVWAQITAYRQPNR